MSIFWKNRSGVGLAGEEWWRRLMAAMGARARGRSGKRANEREGTVKREGDPASVGTRGCTAVRVRRASAAGGRAGRASARIVETRESEED